MELHSGKEFGAIVWKNRLEYYAMFFSKAAYEKELLAIEARIKRGVARSPGDEFYILTTTHPIVQKFPVKRKIVGLLQIKKY